MTPRLKGWPRTMLRGLLDMAGRVSSRRRFAERYPPESARLVRGWMVMLLLGGVAAYAIAEEITLTTYYPSPRGVYDQLRTAGNVQIGSIEPPTGDPDNEAPRLHVVKDSPRDSFDVRPALRVDAQGAGVDANAVVIDRDGNVGIGTARPEYKLDVRGGRLNLPEGACIAGECQTQWPTGTVLYAVTDTTYLAGAYYMGEARSVSEEAAVSIPVPAGTLKNLMMGQTVPLADGGSRGVAITVFKNGASTPLHCNIVVGAQRCSDLDHAVPVAQGDLVSFYIENTGHDPNLKASVELR